MEPAVSPMLSLEAARHLLQSFDVADDQESLNFLADLLASGTAPQDEVDALGLLREIPSVNSEAPAQLIPGATTEDGGRRPAETGRGKPKGKKTGEKRQRKKKNKSSRKLTSTDSSPFFGPNEQGDDRIPAVSSYIQPVAVVKTTTIFYPESRAASPDLGSDNYTPYKSTESTFDAPDINQGIHKSTTITIREKRPQSGRPSLHTSPSRKEDIKSYLSDNDEPDGSGEVDARIPAPGTPTKIKVPGLKDAPSTNSGASSPSYSPFVGKTASTPLPKQRATTSRFFDTPPSSTKRKLSDAGPQDRGGEAESPTKQPKNAPPILTRRPSRGSVSALPFAPLSASRFGLVQEELAHDPFWLLVALVFLVRVSGRVSLPVFWQTKALYPRAEDLVAADPTRLVQSMRHLGMASVRCAAIQRYARRWLERPPQPGVCTAVKNYPPLPEAEERGERGAPPTATSSSMWEIGHLTQGTYAVDSWRIFCRDALLGVDGSSSDSTAVQPEWMRVLPRDKELRAYLRWMWMREGWEWDPMTGERAVLREELRCAVEEGRAGYDVHGQLQIIDTKPEEEDGN